MPRPGAHRATNNVRADAHPVAQDTRRTEPPGRRVVDVGPPPTVSDRRCGLVGRRESDVAKVTCPWCGSQASRVEESYGAGSKRRVPVDAYGRLRRCLECSEVFPTFEGLDVAAFNRRLARRGLMYDELERTVKPRE